MVVAFVCHDIYGKGEPVKIGPFQTREVFGHLQCTIGEKKVFKNINEDDTIVLGGGFNEHKIEDSNLLDIELDDDYHLIVSYYGDILALQKVKDSYS